jgi:4-amino-4-deoxy-L-arabinose transferase-like glycosyltransferase
VTTTPSRQADGPGRAPALSRCGRGLVLLAILGVTAAVRVRLLAVPLDRDEGEYAYLGQLILRGETPYLAAHNMKLPGVYYAYAGILALLGETDVAIRLGLLAINLASIAVLYLLGRRLLDATAGLAAAAAYAMLSLGQAVDGFTAKAEHFVVLPMLAGALLLAPRPPAGAGRIAGAGVLLGVSVLMKQHGAAFVAFGGLWLLLEGVRARAWRHTAGRCLLFAAAALAPYALLCLGLWRAGAFEEFWFWTVTYARTYVTMTPLGAGLAQLGRTMGDMVGAAPALWLLAAVGLTTPWWDGPARGAAGFVGLLAVCSAAAVSAGFRFSAHYFILALPAVGLLIGAAVSALGRLADTRRPAIATVVRAGLPAVAVAVTLVRERAYLFSLPPPAVARATYGLNPFPEAVEIARYLREHTRPDERVAVIGSEPQIYFYAGRGAATSYIYMYPLMEPNPFAHRMQAEMIAQLERARPRYLVLVNVDASWSRRPESSVAVMEWAERATAADYRLVGVTEILPDGSSAYHWDDAAPAALLRSRTYLLVYERRD